jgi:nucleotide-binding universal stress UspA family protein
MVGERASFVAECFWPDVTEADLEALDRRIGEAAAELAPENAVRYTGSILLRDDEVVLCQFEGSAETVHDVAERAGVPFDRILAAAHSPWPLS